MNFLQLKRSISPLLCAILIIACLFLSSFFVLLAEEDVSANMTVGVWNQARLQQALDDPNVSGIILMNDIVLSSPLRVDVYPSRAIDITAENTSTGAKIIMNTNQRHMIISSSNISPHQLDLGFQDVEFVGPNASNNGNGESNQNLGGGIASEAYDAIINFENLIIRGCYHQSTGQLDEGGALSLYGPSTLQSCTIVGNKASGVNGSGSGGGVFSYDGTLKINNSLIQGNYSESIRNSSAGTRNYTFGGGGVYCNSNLEVVGSQILDNKAEGVGSQGVGYALGGGILGSQITLDNYQGKDMIVSGNYASGSGGGVSSVWAGSIVADNATITNNTAGGSAVSDRAPVGGGGLYGKTIDLTDTTVSGNKATGTGEDTGGGGILTHVAGDVALTNSTLQNNEAYSGGGIFCVNGSISTIPAQDASYVEVTGTSLIMSNKATKLGGGIYGKSNDELIYSVIVSDTARVQGNTAEDGAGIYLLDENTDTTQGSIALLGNAQVINNTASGNGGGIYANVLSQVTAAATTSFAGNTASTVETIKPADIALHAQNIRTSSFSTGSYAYNNYDIAYQGISGPKEIWNWEDLAKIPDAIDEGYTEFKLMQDLGDPQVDARFDVENPACPYTDADKRKGGYGFATYVTPSDPGWTPIGTLLKPFSAEFDGNKHTINNIHAKRADTNYIGLFGYASDAYIHDLGVNVGSKSFQGNQYVGGLAGYMQDSSVERCYVNGPIYGTLNVGGMFGGVETDDATKFIRDSYATGQVVGSVQNIGGFMGYFKGTYLERCFSSGFVNYKGNSTGKFGGFIGMIDNTNINATVNNNYYAKDISGDHGGVGATLSVKGSDYDGHINGINIEDMTKAASYTSWNVGAANGTWAIDEAVTLPYLSWQKNRGLSDTYDVQKIVYRRAGANTYTKKFSGYTLASRMNADTFLSVYYTNDNAYRAYFPSADNYSTNLPAGTSTLSFSVKQTNQKLVLGAMSQSDLIRIYIEPATYEIWNWEDLAGVAAANTADDYDIFVLMQDLGDPAKDNRYLVENAACDYTPTAKRAGGYGYSDYVSGTASSWTSLGTSTDPFLYEFDGNQHSISDLTVNQASSYAGLFGSTAEYAYLYDLGVNIADSGVKGDQNVGGLAGMLRDSRVERCYTNGPVSGQGTVGGMFGAVITMAEDNYIRDCYSAGYTAGDNNTGGFIGMYQGTYLERCFSTGYVHTTAASGTLSANAGFIGSINLSTNRDEVINTMINHNYYTSDNAGFNGGVAIYRAPSMVREDYPGHIDGMTTENATKAASYDASWNLNGATWSVDENYTLPYLAWQKGRGLNDTYSVTKIKYRFTPGKYHMLNYWGYGVQSKTGNTGISYEYTNNDAYRMFVSNNNNSRITTDRHSATVQRANQFITLGSMSQSDIICVYFEDNAIQIWNWEDLAKVYSEGYLNGERSFRLMQDLGSNAGNSGNGAGAPTPEYNDTTKVGYYGYDQYVSNPATGWEPMMSMSDLVFDGNGHMISDLRIDRPAQDNVGLFSTLEDSTVENLEITTSSAGVSGRKNVGIILGNMLRGTGVGYVASSVTMGTVTGSSDVGGMVGTGAGMEFLDCYSEAQVKMAEGANGAAFGGIIGSVDAAVVTACYSTGRISGYENVGGVVGSATNSMLYNDYAVGPVTGSKNVGGLVGNISDCGVEHSYAIGKVTGDENVGGFIGNSASSAYASSYYDTLTTKCANAVGNIASVAGITGRETADMTKEAQVSFFYGTNQMAPWQIVEGVTYPYLYWQDQTATSTMYDLNAISAYYNNSVTATALNLTNAQSVPFERRNKVELNVTLGHSSQHSFYSDGRDARIVTEIPSVTLGMKVVVQSSSKDNIVKPYILIATKGGVEVSGTLAYDGGFRPATVTLYDGSNNVVQTVEVTTTPAVINGLNVMQGSFSFPGLEPGIYKITTHKKNHTSATVTEIPLYDDIDISTVFMMYAGDMDPTGVGHGDNFINNQDLSVLLGSMYASGPDHPNDLNDDDVVDNRDRSLQASNMFFRSFPKRYADL